MNILLAGISGVGKGAAIKSLKDSGFEVNRISSTVMLMMHFGILNDTKRTPTKEDYIKLERVRQEEKLAAYQNPQFWNFFSNLVDKEKVNIFEYHFVIPITKENGEVDYYRQPIPEIAIHHFNKFIYLNSNLQEIVNRKNNDIASGTRERVINTVVFESTRTQSEISRGLWSEFVKNNPDLSAEVIENNSSLVELAESLSRFINQGV